MSDDELIREINSAAYEVRRSLVPGFAESVYQTALAYELQLRGLTAICEYPLNIAYKDVCVGHFRADILVEDRIILEIKAVRDIEPFHEAQLVNYLTVSGLSKGILINYGGSKFAFRIKDKEYKSSKLNYITQK